MVQYSERRNLIDSSDGSLNVEDSAARPVSFMEQDTFHSSFRDVDSDCEEDEREIRLSQALAKKPIDEKSGEMGTMMHLFKGNMGTGVLAFPFAIKSAGLFTGTGLILVLGAICIHCMHLLVNGAHLLRRSYGDHVAKSYADIFELAFENGPHTLRKCSKIARPIINGFLMITQIGFCCVYVLFVAANVKQVVQSLLKEYPDISLTYYMLIVTFFLILYCFVTDLKSLAPFSIFANILTIVGLLIILQNILVGFKEWKDLPQFTDGSGLALFFGTAIYSFEGIGIILPLENQMRTPKSFAGLTGVLHTSMCAIVCIYVAIGFFGYLKFGKDVCGSVTLNLPDGGLYLGVKLMFAIGVFISYNLQLFVPAEMLWKGKLKGVLEHRMGATSLKWTERLMRSVIVLFTFALAVAVPYLDLFISLIGSLASSALALIFPPLIDILLLSTREDISRFRCATIVIKDVAIICLGFLGFGVGTTETVMQIVDAFRGKRSGNPACD